MARRITTLTIATLVAMVALLPAWAQVSVPGPAVVTTKVGNLMFGSDPTDSTLTWTTTLRLVNRTQSQHNALLALTDTAGKPISASVKLAFRFSTSAPGSNMNSGLISPLGEMKLVLTGLPDATAIPVTLTAQTYLNADGLGNVVVEALVQETDSTGKILQSYTSVDPTTVVPATGTAFAIAADMGLVGNDTTLLLSNPGAGVIMVTVAVYDGFNVASSMQNRVPVASVQIPLSSGMAAQTLSQLFALNQDYANFVSQVSGSSNLILGQNVITVTSDQPLALAVSRANSSPDGTVFQTSANSFPLAPPAAQ